MATSMPLILYFIQGDTFKDFHFIHPRECWDLSRDLGLWRSSPSPFQMCDFEYVIHPPWAVYVIFKDLPALLFWNYVSVFLMEQPWGPHPEMPF